MKMKPVTQVAVGDVISYPRMFAQRTVERIEYRMHSNGTDFIAFWFAEGRLGIHNLDESVIVL